MAEMSTTRLWDSAPNETVGAKKVSRPRVLLSGENKEVLIEGLMEIQPQREAVRMIVEDTVAKETGIDIVSAHVLLKKPFAERPKDRDVRIRGCHQGDLADTACPGL